jgi:tetratricopeptide (TPR) repeat protein
MEKEVELTPGYLPARIELGDLYLRVGEAAAAEAHLRRGLEINPKLSRGHYLLGKALADSGRENEALTSFQTAAQLDPRLPEPDYAMSQIFLKQGKLDLARQYVQSYKEKKLRSGQP